MINNVTFTGNQAVGGGGGSDISGPTQGGGGGVGGPGGTTASGVNGNGNGGGDFGSSGGEGTNGTQNPGDGGGGGGSDVLNGNPGGTFGGNGVALNPGGSGGAGLGGAIFMRNGTLSLANAVFSSNSATGGIGQAGAGNGQGKGGALYISSTASAVSTTSLTTLFNSNSATNAGSGTACNTQTGAGALDTNDLCGILTGSATHFSVSAPASATAGLPFVVTVTALDENNNIAAGYAGTVHLTSTDAGFSGGDRTLIGGVGTFTVEMFQSGAQTITATDTVNESITGTSNNILVSPGPPEFLMLSTPPTTDAGETFSFSVTVTDLFLNPATNYSGTLHSRAAIPRLCSRSTRHCPVDSAPST